MTSFGNGLEEDQMIVEKEKEGEEIAELEKEIKKVNLPKISTMFQQNKKEAVETWIIKSRFGDDADKATIRKRRVDFGNDCNMNLVRGKVIRSTTYFDELILESNNEIVAYNALKNKCLHVSCKIKFPFTKLCKILNNFSLAFFLFLQSLSRPNLYIS